MLNQPHLSSVNASEPTLGALIPLLQNFCEAMSAHGINIRPLSDRGLARLQILPVGQIQEIYANFQSYYSLCVSAVNQGIHLKDSKSFVAYALKLYKMQVEDDFLNTIQPEDIIEFYDGQGVQFFRNLIFFEITSYSLADIISHEWSELYFRPQLVVKSMLDFSTRVMMENKMILSHGTVTKHLMKEILTTPEKVIEVDFKGAAPIYNLQNEICGLIVGCAARSMEAEVTSHGLDFI